jgi:anti-sigma regulatory factor (Ser/Thr protein kinase)
MTATTDPTASFRHELVLHHGTAELLELMVPFAREGAAAGDHVVVFGEPQFVDTFRSAVPEVPLHLLARPRRDRLPGRELHRAQQLLAEFDHTGPQVRIINQMPAMTGREWLAWRRYEAAANVALAPFRGWGKCAHDLANLDPGIVAELRASHPFLQSGVGSGRNADFDELGAHTLGFLDVPRHPVEDSEPTVSLIGPTAAAARRAMRELGALSGLSSTAQECLVLAASEAVTNGWIHGRPPVTLRAWAEVGQVTVAVSDNGAGPDPLVGMLAAPPDSPSGRGMWMVHQLLPEVHHRRGHDGYTITFSVDGDIARLIA